MRLGLEGLGLAAAIFWKAPLVSPHHSLMMPNWLKGLYIFRFPNPGVATPGFGLTPTRENG